MGNQFEYRERENSYLVTYNGYKAKGKRLLCAIIRAVRKAERYDTKTST